MLLPSIVQSNVTGDAIAGIAISPYVLKAVAISGNLTVEPSVVIRFEGNNLTADSNVVGGSLTVGAGASLLCAAPLSYKYLSVTGLTTVNGTSAAPVLFSRSPLGSGFNNYCLINLGAANVRYARLSATPLNVGAPSTIRDSTFDPIGNNGDRTSAFPMSGQVASDVLFEFNRFVKAEIRGHGFTARNNDFDGVSYDTSITLCSDCLANGACVGTRNTDPKVLIRDNAFTSASGRSIFSVDRAYSAINISGNFFTPTLVPSNFDMEEGT